MPPQNHAAKIYYFFVFPALLFQFAQVNAQVDESHLHNHTHAHTDDALHDEIAAGMGISWSDEYQSFSPGFHLHIKKGLTPYLGIAAGYELILTGELHQSILILASIRPIRRVEINIGPGIGIPTHDETWYMSFHSEISTTWPIGKYLHAGPMFDFGWSSHGTHLATGLHVGFDL